ncbi:phage-related DNA polymerase [Ferrigenium kumadai]|uniref:Type-4 uracil-DNA glycosylase n=1 Tax=Ferrigenium kumadai TaxID=1682490 RepID=A0AAN1SZH0_9PROT|nr:uracil-DNA glycosylase [Ferrigenium kumadai]BBI99927.1 phage-related DNA polymerase [Ferrigenium kumadai]
MDRQEAVLRELNLYPLWQRRGAPAPMAGNPEADVESTPPIEASIETAAAVAPPAAEASRVGGGEADTQQSVTGIAEPVLSADEGFNPSCASSPSLAAADSEPATIVTTGNGEQNREQRIAELGWPELKTMVRDCTACKLRAGCTQTVFGVGDEQADWLFVGEGPGADEDVQGEPFVGQAGKLLDNMLMSVKLKRGNNVYIANIVKCRPPGNRTPEADEIATCFPYLQRQIQLIRPKVIVALGKTAATALLGRDAALGSLRGTTHDYQGIPLIVTYHPAYLLRSPLEKAKAWEDLCRAMQVFNALP